MSAHFTTCKLLKDFLAGLQQIQVNDINHIAGSSVKQSSKPEGTTASFVTIEEDARQKKKRNEKLKAEKKKEKAAAAMATGGSGANPPSENDGKIPKELSHIECC